MSKLLKISLVASLFAVSSPAYAQIPDKFSPNQSFSFTGSLDMIKNLPLISSCTVPVTIDIDSAGDATIDAGSFTGTGAGCGFISFSGAPYKLYHDNFSGTPSGTANIFATNARIEIAYISPFNSGPDACEGLLTIQLSNDGTNSILTFDTAILDGLPNGGPNTDSTKNCIVSGELFTQDGIILAE